MIVLASLTDTAQGIVETFGIDWPMLIAQAINFLIVAFVIWKFAFKNILSTIKEREKQIADSLKNADKIKLELEETEKQQETLQEASLAAKKTISSAQEQAKAFIEAQKEDARKQAEEIIAKAKIAMEQERERVLNEARDEIASLVVLTTAKVLSKELSEQDKNQFASRATEELKLSS
jgi:F-type H+-transporting ATPase subunit b